MRKFILIWSVALTTAALIFFYQMKLFSTAPINIHIYDLLVIGAGAVICVVFFIWALRLAPKIYRLAITGIGGVIWIFAVFLWLSNIIISSMDIQYLSVIDFIAVLAIGIVVGYGAYISKKVNKED